jgi:hypothetical protein
LIDIELARLDESSEHFFGGGVEDGNLGAPAAVVFLSSDNVSDLGQGDALQVF